MEASLMALEWLSLTINCERALCVQESNRPLYRAICFMFYNVRK